jgi:hypothetical protein
VTGLGVEALVWTTSVTPTISPSSMFPSWQEKTVVAGPAASQLPCAAVADTAVVPTGTGLWRSTLIASPGPLPVTVTT